MVDFRRRPPPAARFAAFLLAGLLPAASLVAQAAIDGVVAVVGDEVVLKSELVQMTQYYALQMGLQPDQQKEEFSRLQAEVLENLIDDRVLLAKAKEDTVTVDDARVEAELENRIQSMVQQLGSVQKVEAQFGAPIKKIKRDNRDEVQRVLIVRELQNTKFRGLQVSRREIQSFYESIKDSLPEKRPSVRLSQILLRVRPGEASRVQALEKIEGLKKRLAAGEPFEALAREASEDPGTARYGGELGFVERGTFFTAFEEAVFKLEPGQVSDVVETPIGFHLIQAVEKRGDQVNCRHILVRVEKSDLDEQKVLERAEGLRTRILAGEDFAQLARTFSDDSTSKDQGGALGEFTLEDIQIEAFRNAVDTLEAGEVSRPFLTQFGIHLVRLEARKGARRYNLEEDYDTFRGRALDMKMQKLRKAWIEDLKKTVYIDVKQDML